MVTHALSLLAATMFVLLSPRPKVPPAPMATFATAKRYAAEGHVFLELLLTVTTELPAPMILARTTSA